MNNINLDSLPTDVSVLIMNLQTLIEDQQFVIDSQRRAMELQSKGFLRCARDLKHCASDLNPTSVDEKLINHMRARADMWADMANSPMGYKDNIYTLINQYEKTIELYRQCLKDNSIVNTIEKELVPF